MKLLDALIFQVFCVVVYLGPHKPGAKYIDQYTLGQLASDTLYINKSSPISS